MNKRIFTLLFLLLLLPGLALLLYPTVGNVLNTLRQNRAIAVYEEQVVEREDTEPAFQAARAYNRILAEGSLVLQSGPPVNREYQSLLALTDDGLMGSLTIPKLGLRVLLYHGTEESRLAAGVGHLEGSSLPVGGESTHAVITGHRGLPSAKLFTDLNRLKVGDLFFLTVLDQTLYYRVDQIEAVLPEETQAVAIVPGGDYCTLLTCTPYAVNTHQLLVRKMRTDEPEESPASGAAFGVGTFVPLLLLVPLFLMGERRKRGKG